MRNHLAALYDPRSSILINRQRWPRRTIRRLNSVLHAHLLQQMQRLGIGSIKLLSPDQLLSRSHRRQLADVSYS